MKVIPIENIKTIKEEVNLIYRDSSIGDIVACEPIVDIIQEGSKRTGWVINEKFLSLLCFHPKIDYLVTVKNRDQAWQSLVDLPENIRPILLYMRPRDSKTLEKYGRFLKVDKRINAGTYYNYGGLLEVFTKAAGFKPKKLQPKFYLDPNIKSVIKDKNNKVVLKYICVHCRSNKDDYGRDWDDDKWNELMEYFVEREIYVVEVGMEPVIKSKSRFYINKTDVRDLQEVAHIVNNSFFFIGIDSGFAHVANALQKDGVCLVGKIRGIFYYHTPFTGKFQYRGILRAPLNQAVFHLKVSKVIEFFENYGKSYYMFKVITSNWLCRNIVQNFVVARNTIRRIIKNARK